MRKSVRFFFFFDIVKCWTVIVDLQDNYKKYNIHIMGISEREERVKGRTEDRFEVMMAKIFSKLMTASHRSRRLREH